MRKASLFLGLVLSSLLVFLYVKPITALAVCNFEIDKECSSGPGSFNRLKIKWELDQGYGCNIFIQAGSYNSPVSNDCKSGAWQSWNYVTGLANGVPITNDGIYKLIVSNGTSECLNQEKEVRMNCSASSGVVPTNPPPSGSGEGKFCWICDGSQDMRKAGGPRGDGLMSSGECDTEGGVFQKDKPSSSIITQKCGGGGASPTSSSQQPDDRKPCWICGGSDWRKAGGPRGDGNLSKSECDTEGGKSQDVAPTGGCGDGQTTQVPTQSPAATEKVVFFQVAESEADLETADKQEYKGKATPYTFRFKDNAPGVRTIYVRFITDKDHKSRAYRKTIILGRSRLTGLSCSYTPTGTGTTIVINGLNLGEQSEDSLVTVGGTEAQIIDWKAEVGESPSPTLDPLLTPPPAGGSTPTPTNKVKSVKSKIVAKLDDRLPGKEKQAVILQNANRKLEGFCRIETTSIELIAKAECRPGDFSGEALVTIREKGAPENIKPVVSQAVKLNKDGRPENFAPVLEKGKTYVMLIKIPRRTLTRKIEFIAGEGTLILPEIIMPVGDIAPTTRPDGKVNTLDREVLSRQWSILADVEKTGDFNGDKRVNSLDWACMRENFNKEDDK